MTIRWGNWLHSAKTLSAIVWLAFHIKNQCRNRDRAVNIDFVASTFSELAEP